MRAALIQLTSGDEIGPNVDMVSELVRAAAAEGASFITTPETSHLMEMNRERVLEKAFQEARDPGLAVFRELAKELKVWLHVGSLIIKVSDRLLANRSFLIAPGGDIAARYDKAHLFDVELGGADSR